MKRTLTPSGTGQATTTRKGEERTNERTKERKKRKKKRKRWADKGTKCTGGQVQTGVTASAWSRIQSNGQTDVMAVLCVSPCESSDVVGAQQLTTSPLANLSPSLLILLLTLLHLHPSSLIPRRIHSLLISIYPCPSLSPSLSLSLSLHYHQYTNRRFLLLSVSPQVAPPS